MNKIGVLRELVGTVPQLKADAFGMFGGSAEFAFQGDG